MLFVTGKLFLHTPHSKHYCTMWVSTYRWGSVEQRGSSSVAMSRSLKMSLGIITSDCNQNSFKWTTGLNGLISSEKIRSVSRLWPLVYQHFILKSKKNTKICTDSKKENHIHCTIIVKIKLLCSDDTDLIPYEPPNVTPQVTSYLWFVFFCLPTRSEI